MLSKPVKFDDGSTPAGIWLELHSTERQWKNTYVRMLNAGGSSRDIALKAIRTQHELLANLSQFSADRWRMLCDGQGWTPLGCSALSWCQGDVTFSEVAGRGKSLHWKIDPEIGSDFAALMLNPAIVPVDLSALLRTEDDDFAVALALASKPEWLPGSFVPPQGAQLGLLTRAMLQAR
ncbi:hypothetical protein [Agrobacterium tumefaciens]|uniref:hypothetical protein n=1 Tax=Agrobacterium tumefaciens TaxID=358 RepID=UPI0015717D30|nr:hypothetical protein [Agrobacterium tumefaciens]NSY51348.1 hypothetical protein [Agrobacterium tumefaciens]NTD86662.1 hypothetical protein [Agrobacterium tumefaciens]NTD93907.1 hypothetical protein [Agrobacterium tumefaciens]NTE03882.1 hypothetical protein [Agrobacterium tumefaciens]NTE11347.1 hypothetical protein [Agrobacterium tumefaciens]